MSIALGSVVKDVVTGYQGIVVSRVSHITACDQYAIVNKQTLTAVADWGSGEIFIDEGRLEVMRPPSKVVMKKLAAQTAKAIEDKIIEDSDQAPDNDPDRSLYLGVAMPGG